MKAMILAAGRGTRMRPLTERAPKALLQVGGASLIAHHLTRLRNAGISEVVINLGHLGAAIKACLQAGDAYGMQITYSDEGTHLLETAGGIVKALPLLGDGPFFVVNADVYTDYTIRPITLQPPAQAHLVMVDNPAHNPHGDFGLVDGFLVPRAPHCLTFSGMGYYTAALFNALPPQPLALRQVLQTAVAQRRVSGEHYLGKWADVGTHRATGSAAPPIRQCEQRRHLNAAGECILWAPVA